MANLGPGSIVLYSQQWNHDNNGRPHIVITACPVRGLRLCPVTSSCPTWRLRSDSDLILARPGGLTRDSWIAAVSQSGPLVVNLCWARPSEVGRLIGQLTSEELNLVLLAATRQLADRKRGLRRCARQSGRASIKEHHEPRHPSFCSGPRR